MYAVNSISVSPTVIDDWLELLFFLSNATNLILPPSPLNAISGTVSYTPLTLPTICSV